LKRYEVHFLAEAVADLDSLFSYVAEKSSYEVADGYLERLELFCRSLETFPRRGTKIQGRVAGLRAMGFERRATVLFRVGKERVEILRILYGGRALHTQ
jgi:toxin ParE1/3/4